MVPGRELPLASPTDPANQPTVLPLSIEIRQVGLDVYSFFHAIVHQMAIRSYVHPLVNASVVRSHARSAGGQGSARTAKDMMKNHRTSRHGNLLIQSQKFF